MFRTNPHGSPLQWMPYGLCDFNIYLIQSILRSTFYNMYRYMLFDMFRYMYNSNLPHGTMMCSRNKHEYMLLYTHHYMILYIRYYIPLAQSTHLQSKAYWPMR